MKKFAVTFFFQPLEARLVGTLPEHRKVGVEAEDEDDAVNKVYADLPDGSFTLDEVEELEDFEE